MPRDTRSASRADRRTPAERGDRASYRPFLLSCAIRVSPASRFAGGLGKKRTPPARWREGFWIVLELALRRDGLQRLSSAPRAKDLDIGVLHGTHLATHDLPIFHGEQKRN